ncbi:hypothetical protein BU25DRAFT_343768, partial [Macroventuria anomochaeta]
LVESYPRGYPSQAAFQSSESSFSIYRSFDYLHSRVILDLQDELRCLESDLSELDEEDGFAPDMERRNSVRSRELDLEAAGSEDGLSPRSALLSTIRDKLVRYDEILLKARELNTFQRPSNRDYRSLRHWCRAKKPLVDEEQVFVMRKEDLISLRQGREWAGFDGWIESSIKRLPKCIKQSLFTTPELREKTKDASIEYYSPSRVEKLVGLIITLIIFVLLVLPVVAMYKLTSVGNRNSTLDAVGLLVVFTLLFSAAMSLLTKAKRHELFAASAAYCAVLVVFISNFSNDGNPNSMGGGRGA